MKYLTSLIQNCKMHKKVYKKNMSIHGDNILSYYIPSLTLIPKDNFLESMCMSSSSGPLEWLCSKEVSGISIAIGISLMVAMIPLVYYYASKE